MISYQNFRRFPVTFSVALEGWKYELYDGPSSGVHVRIHSHNAIRDDEVRLLPDGPSCKSNTCSSDSLLAT